MNKNSKTTPLMEQYHAIKAKHKDAILFFRMGDFYEMFYEDAQTGSQVLGITLTSRAHGKSSDVPLAGFPHHALDGYLTKMIKAGYRVAICEQVEDPKKAKTIVKRDIVEIVTPGTTFSDDILESKRNNFLVALHAEKQSCGIAGIDISTGEFFAGEVSEREINEQIQSLEPAEIIVPESQQPYFSRVITESSRFFTTVREDWIFSRDYGYEILLDHFNTASLKGFGIEDLNTGISAAGAALHYVTENQKNKLPHIRRIYRRDDSDFLTIDPATQRNLELLRPMNERNQGSTLLSVLDQTRTPMGGRLLVQWLVHPLANAKAIKSRLDSLDELFQKGGLRNELRDLFRDIGDLERLVSKISTGRANGRDLNALKSALMKIPQIKTLLTGADSQYMREIDENIVELPDLVDEIEKGIIEDPPLSISDGGIIRPEYSSELDKLREIVYSGKDWIARLQASERDRTGITSLKVKYNKVFGYYIEVTKPHLSKVPDDYMRKQTLVGAERFITPELKEYEEQILGAEEKISALEFELFDKIRQMVAEQVVSIQGNANQIARLDCVASLADVAVTNDYIKPEVIVSDAIVVTDSRHPVVEKLLPPGEAFVPNDIHLDNGKNQILVITGPNMAGKSTYLRQAALVVLLAQMGSFVPAKSARIGLVDKIFTRVGASDNLAGGESTFLMEMNETANILNNATQRSLIILDEIGRGTSTFDGLSIAWAVTEYLHNAPRVAAKTLFATHYHELTELELILPRVKNYNIAVKEWGDKIVFLRKIVEGGCDHSYGIHVAQLAGLPNTVIERAKEVLQNLETHELTPNEVPRISLKPQTGSNAQLEIFEKQEHKLREEINKVDVNSTTPLEALNILNRLWMILKNEQK